MISAAAKEVETCAFPMMASVIKSEKCKLIPKHLLLNTITTIYQKIIQGTITILALIESECEAGIVEGVGEVALAEGHVGEELDGCVLVGSSQCVAAVR